MLALTRKAGEAIVLQIGGTQSTITLVRVFGNKVRLAIDAPEGVVVLRGELLERGQANANDNGDSNRRKPQHRRSPRHTVRRRSRRGGSANSPGR